MRTKHLLALVVVGTLLATSAFAFRPSSRWLFDQMAHKQLQRGVRTLKVEQEVLILGRTDAPKGLVASGLLTTLAPDGWRQEVTLPEGIRRELRGAKKTVVENPGEAAQSRKSRLDFWPMFLLTGDPLPRPDAAERLENAAKEMGVAVDVVSYARFDGRVNFLIGSKPHETDKSQLWIDKDTLLPTRIVMMKKAADGKTSRHDLRLKGWGSPEGGSWFPKSVELWVDGVAREIATTRSVDRNLNLDAALFKVAD